MSQKAQYEARGHGTTLTLRHMCMPVCTHILDEVATVRLQRLPHGDSQDTGTIDDKAA